MAFAFEKLFVYQKSLAFAEAVCTATRRVPARLLFPGGSAQSRGTVYRGKYR